MIAFSVLKVIRYSPCFFLLVVLLVSEVLLTFASFVNDRQQSLQCCIWCCTLEVCKNINSDVIFATSKRNRERAATKKITAIQLSFIF